MRIHCLENVDKGLQFLKDQHVHLENLGCHDIVDGNPRLTLGLIWTIILRFQVIPSDDTLLWCTATRQTFSEYCRRYTRILDPRYHVRRC